MNEPTVVLECQKLTKSFQESSYSVDILYEVDFIANRGEQIAIVGYSGSGKTTLLQLLGGLEKPDSGTVLLNNINLQAVPEQKLAKLRNEQLGFVYQFHHLFPEFTALENVAMPLLIRNLAIKDVFRAAKLMLNKLDLANRYEHIPAQLSGGERQRVAIARSLIGGPKCVLADEPTGSLDNKTAKNLFNLLKMLSQELQTTFIVVTHDERIANTMDKKFLLENSKLKQM